MFLVWTGSVHRPTRDIDLLGLTEPDEGTLVETFKTICAEGCPEDGVIFEPSTVTAETIREQSAYGGIRVNLVGMIGRARIPLQVDVGFGDAVFPEPKRIELPGLLVGVPSVKLHGYSAETAVAEKFQAMVLLGMGNSRMKDFLDIAHLADNYPIERAVLKEAIVETFKRRGTALPIRVPVALTWEFYENALVQERWQAFVKKNLLASPYNSLPYVIDRISSLVLPIDGSM
jgi:hypothetical protein